MARNDTAITDLKQKCLILRGLLWPGTVMVRTRDVWSGWHICTLHKLSVLCNTMQPCDDVFKVRWQRLSDSSIAGKSVVT